MTLTLAGLGRAMAAASRAVGADDVIPGVHVPICHAGEEPAAPVQPGSHDCCDDCALPAVAVLPAPPALSDPVAIAHVADHAHAIPWAPDILRPRSPRLARGPPAA